MRGIGAIQRAFTSSRPGHWALVAVTSMFACTWCWYKIHGGLQGFLLLPAGFYWAPLALCVALAASAVAAFGYKWSKEGRGVTGALIILLGLIATDLLWKQARTPETYVGSILGMAEALLVGLVIDHALENKKET
jgi:hypothetical protein